MIDDVAHDATPRGLDERPYTQQAIATICARLRRLPKTASAKEMNAQLRACWGPDYDYSYSLWRKCVRRVMAERARLAAWEGADDATLAAMRPARHHRKANAA